MAVEIIAPEPNLYVTVWTPFVDASQINAAMRQIYQHVDTAGEDRFVIVANMSAMKRIPFEIRGIRAWLDDDARALAFINMGSPFIMSSLRSVFQQIKMNKIVFTTSQEEAFALARTALVRPEMLPA